VSSKAVGKLVNKYNFNGGNELQSGEFNDGSGLDIYDFNARTYDQQLGRFIQIDPMSEEEDQESWSPYHFGYNNPIRYNDPDGKFPIPIIGAIVGAVADIAVQSIEIALDNHKSFSRDFSFASVGVSAFAGATGAGLATKIGKLGIIAKLAIEATHDVAASAANQYAKEGKVNLKQAAVDATIGKAIGDLAGNSVSKTASKTHGAKVMSNQLDRAKRVAENNPRPSRTAKVNDAQKKLDNYVARRVTAASTSSSNVGSNVANKILGTDNDKKKEK